MIVPSFFFIFLLLGAEARKKRRLHHLSFYSCDDLLHELMSIDEENDEPKNTTTSGPIYPVNPPPWPNPMMNPTRSPYPVNATISPYPTNETSPYYQGNSTLSYPINTNAPDPINATSPRPTNETASPYTSNSTSSHLSNTTTPPPINTTGTTPEFPNSRSDVACTCQDENVELGGDPTGVIVSGTCSYIQDLCLEGDMSGCFLYERSTGHTTKLVKPAENICNAKTEVYIDDCFQPTTMNSIVFGQERREKVCLREIYRHPCDNMPSDQDYRRCEIWIGDEKCRSCQRITWCDLPDRTNGHEFDCGQGLQNTCNFDPENDFVGFGSETIYTFDPANRETSRGDGALEASVMCAAIMVAVATLMHEFYV